MKTSTFHLPTPALLLLLVCGLFLTTGAATAQYVGPAYEAPGDCEDGIDNDLDLLQDRGVCTAGTVPYCTFDFDCNGGGNCDISNADPDCLTELLCQNDVDDDKDGLDDRGVCSTSGTWCTQDSECPPSEFCDRNNMDPNCFCMWTDSGFGAPNDCTAGDVRVSFVGLGDPLDPCLSSTDSVTIDNLAAQIETPGANRRYDIMIWLALDGGDARGSDPFALTQFGHCSQVVLRPPIYSCSGSATACFSDDDCPGVETCELSNPAGGDTVIPTDAQLTSGVGPYRNMDGNYCGDIRGGDVPITDADGKDLLDATYAYPYPVTFACNDGDDDGQVDISSCTGYDNNASGFCQSIDSGGLFDSPTIPNNSSKCLCAQLETNIPVANLQPPDGLFSCSCAPQGISPGFTSTCTVTYQNEDAAGCDDSDAANPACAGDNTVACTVGGTECTGNGVGTCSVTTSTTCFVDGDCPSAETCEQNCSDVLAEQLRCGSAAFVEFEVVANTTNGSVTGAFTSDGSVSNVGGVVNWDPQNPRGADNVISDGQTGSMSFDFLVDQGTCSVTTTTECTADSDCPDGETCTGLFDGTISHPVTFWWSTDPSMSGRTEQKTTTCDMDIVPFYAPISSFRAYEDRGRVVVEWSTAVEHATHGFDLYRQNPRSQQFQRVNPRMLPGTYHLPGGVYRFVDDGASPHERHTYQLVEHEGGRARRTYGPFQVEVDFEFRPDNAAMDDPFRATPRPPSARELTRLAASKIEKQEKRGRGRGLGLGGVRGPAAPAPSASTASVLGVRETGLYLVPWTEIGGGKKPRFSLTQGRDEVAWYGSKDLGGLVFFGQGIDSAYTAENAYRLDGVSGLEMGHVNGGGPQHVTGLQSFVDTVHFEEDLLMRTYIGLDPDNDYWFWGVLAAGNPDFVEQTLALDVGGPAGVGTAELSLRVFGWQGTNEMELWLNGVQIAQPQWQGMGPRRLDVSVSASLLQEGNNDLRLVMRQNFALVDSVDLRYERLYRAKNDSLIFTGDGSPMVTVDGFSSGAIHVFDVSDPLRPLVIKAIRTGAAPGGGYRVSFRPETGSRYALASAVGFRLVDSMRADHPSDLLAPTNSGEYLVIAPEMLADEAQALADLRASQGFSTAVALVEDIMDEVNYGVSSPKAIQGFLAYAHANWSQPPRLVALAGGGSLDFKDNLGLGGNLVPPLVVASGSDLVASDLSLGDVDGDGVPEMAVGRIPVLTGQELIDFVNKLAGFEGGLGGDWTDTVLMLADDPDRGGDFYFDSDTLIAGFPPEVSAEKIYHLNPLSLEEARKAFVDGVNAGAGYVNLVGHGGITQFTAEGMVRTDEVQQLSNGTQLPVVTALTCFIGYFGLPGVQSLGEEMVLWPGGGAAAVWSPAGLSFDSEAIPLGDANFGAFFAEGSGVLGDALLAAYQSFVDGGGKPDKLRVYNLLGDPATSLP